MRLLPFLLVPELSSSLPTQLTTPIPQSEPLFACCDLGGTNLRVGLVHATGQLVASERFAVGERTSPEHVIEAIAVALVHLLEQTGHTQSELVAFGCSATGVMNVQTGFFYHNHHFGWKDVPFCDLLSARIHMPVILEMDSNAAALGEGWLGAAQGWHSYALVIVGTGIGAGLVLDGRIRHGARGVAGEIGHTTLLPNGPLCGCGKHGCLEALAAGPAIARKAEAAIKLGRECGVGNSDSTVTAKELAQSARLGNPVAQEIFDEAGYYLGIGLANLTTLLDLQGFVLAGGVGTGAFDLLEPCMTRGLQQHLNYWADRTTPVRKSTLGDDAGLLGAAWAAWSRGVSNIQ